MAQRDKPIPTEQDVGNVHTGSALREEGGLPAFKYSSPEEFLKFDSAIADKIEGAFDTAASAMDKQAQQKEKLWAIQQVTDAKLKFGGALKNQYINKKEVNTDDFMQSFTEHATKVAESAPSGRAKDLMVKMFTEMEAPLAEKSLAVNAHARVQSTNDFLQDLIQTIRGDTQRDPSPQNTKENARLGQEAIDSADDLPLPMKEKAQGDLENSTHDAVLADASADPAAGVEKFDNGDYNGLVHPEAMPGLRSFILAGAVQNASAAKAKADAAYPSLLHSAKFNGPTADQGDSLKMLAMAEAAGAATSKSAKKIYDTFMAKGTDDLNYANTFYNAHMPMLSLPESQMDAYLDKWKPASDDPNYEQKNKLYDELWAYAYGNGKGNAERGKGVGRNESYNYPGLINQRDEDPHGYAITNSLPLQALQKQAAGLATQAQANPQAAAQLLPAIQGAQSELIRQSLVYQGRLGISTQDQQVMSKDEATNYADKLQNASDINGVKQAVASIASQYGNYFPQAVRALQQLPDKKRQLGAGYTILLANADNPVLTNKLSLALSRPEEDVKKILANAQGFGDDKQAEATLNVQFNKNPEFKAWKDNNYELAGYSPSSERYVNDVQGAMRKLTVQYIQEGKGITDAAQKAASDVFSSSYKTIRTDAGFLHGGKEMAVARKDENGRPYNEEFLNNLGSTLDAKKSQVFANAVDQSRYPGVDPELLKSNSKWVASPDNQGARLLYTPPGYLPEPVFGKNKQPVEVRFSDLAYERAHLPPTAWQRFSKMVTPERLTRELGAFVSDGANILND